MVDSNDKSNGNLVSSKSTDSHLLQMIKVYAEEKGKMKKIQKCKIENKETNSDAMTNKTFDKSGQHHRCLNYLNRPFTIYESCTFDPIANFY